jgi:SSS family solute:Na+ symporter
MMTEPTPDAQLAGLVYGATEIPDDGAHALWQKPIFWACIVIVVFFVLNLIFW